MAYYSREYYPDFSPLSLQSDYPPPRPDYPPYEPYYPRRREAYPPYGPEYPPLRQGYPPLPKSAEARRLESNIGPVTEYSSTNYVVNKRYKYYGIFLCFLSIASFAIEIANVVYTVINLDSSQSLNLPYILTWIAAGTWGSIPVFITGVLAIKVAGTYKGQVRVFVLFCSLSAAVFAPAMIAVSVAEIIMYPQYTGENLPIVLHYSFDKTATLVCVKFILPLVVAILGGIEFYLTLMVTITFWCCYRPGKEVKKTKVSSMGVSSLPVEDQPTAYPPDAFYSPYPEVIRRRQAPFYRSLPPMGADPERQIGMLPSRGDVAPDMSFLRSYPVSRPCTSRGFGIASAYNHGLSYGNLPGTTSVSPFYGSIPSLAAFGAPGPNPAYRIIYN